jgi:D-tyrosyl-tRNA(Tyr) deacylase
MKLVIQRVSQASVCVSGQEISAIGRGLLVLLGIADTDTAEDIAWLVPKLVKLRIFNDAEGIMNLSVNDTGGEILLISQFTLLASTKKGNRPSYIHAAAPEHSLPLYRDFIVALQKETPRELRSGQFGADMQVSLLNDGPVTILIDSRNRE